MSVVQLFFTFLLIGAVSFGGGYGMIPLIRETVLGNGWLTENAFVSAELRVRWRRRSAWCCRRSASSRQSRHFPADWRVMRCSAIRQVRF